jgi:hypothetical protein
MHPVLRLAAVAGSMLRRTDVRVESGDEIYALPGAPLRFGFEHHFRADEFGDEATAAGLSVVHETAGNCPATILTSAPTQPTVEPSGGA